MAEASAFVASVPLSPAPGVAVVGCAAAAAGSVVPGVVAGLSDVAVPVCVVVAALVDGAFGATGAAAATTFATDVAGAAGWGLTGVADAWPVDV